ncbi:hypothetical protein SCUCBS95973_004973 [Sporothrix curviconia]|uniref:WW domain-containing protein n=1 Tax=Sporothrix curviconia TaxID=1260050 RepID=A0ABP0BTU1_9PEZI
MDREQISPEHSQAELPRAQEDQTPANTPSRPPSRKRHLDSDDDEPRTKRARTASKPTRLTRQNLALFNKMGKKGTNKETPSAPNGILDPLDSKPPPNIEDVRERLARSRATASPPETEYKRYIHKVEGAPNNATLVYEVGGKLLKEYDDEGYSRAFNQAFTGYPENVGFNNGLSAPQPDFVEGLRKREYRPFPVDERVSGAVLYKDDPHSLKLPHLAGEWKGPGKNMKEARMQAAYDGAALVYARNQALDTMGEPYLADDAKVTTFTTDGTNLSLFAHHAAPTEEGVLEYYQYPIKSINLIDSHQGYKEGRKHLRNAQDYAKEQSYALKDQLKEHYKQQRSASSTLHPVAAEVPPLPVLDVEPLATTQTYEDGDGGDYGVVGPQPVYSYQPTPPASSKPKHNKSHHSHHSHHSHSAPHSSGGLSPTHSSARNSGGKRKASSSQSFHELSEHISKHGSYWKKDAVSGQYYCKHSDGTVSWRDDEEDEHDCS